MTAEKKNILIIDNEKEFTSLIKTFLEESCSLNIKVVPDGYNGINMAAKLKPDLILLDVLMPAMNGFSILEKLKHDEKTASIPVIMITALDNDKYKQKARELNCMDYLVKPIKLEVLRNTIKKALNL